MEAILPALFLLAIPLSMLFFFKSNVGIMFFAACSGLVLLGNLDSAVVSTAGAVVPGEGEAYVRLAVVVLSMAFAGLVFRDTTAGSAMILSSLISVVLAAMLVLTLPSATGVSWLIEGTNQESWRLVNDYRALIIAAGFSLSLVAALTSQHKRKSKH